MKAPAGMIASNSTVLSSSFPTAVTLAVGLAVTSGNVDVIVIDIDVSITVSIVESVVAVMIVAVVSVRILVVMATSTVDDVLVAAMHYTKGYNE